MDALWTTKDVAKYVKLSERFLEMLRVRGEGPTVVMFGRAVRYRKEDVDAWIDSNLATVTPNKKKRPRSA